MRDSTWNNGMSAIAVTEPLMFLLSCRAGENSSDFVVCVSLKLSVGYMFLKTAVTTLWFYPHLLFRYTFYDGPPFATGLPHYGHILAGTIKDIVTRFAHQSGFHVDRRFGWDCHGLPVVRDPRLRRRPRETFRPPPRDSRACLAFSQEYEIDKTLGIKGPDDVAKMGIAEYNKQCRGIVMRYSKEWEVRVFQTSSILGTHLKLCLLIKFDCCCVVELLKFTVNYIKVMFIMFLRVWWDSEKEWLNLMPETFEGVGCVSFYFILFLHRLLWNEWDGGLTSRMTTRLCTHGSWRLSGRMKTRLLAECPCVSNCLYGHHQKNSTQDAWLPLARAALFPANAFFFSFFWSFFILFFTTCWFWFCSADVCVSQKKRVWAKGQ